MARNSKIFLRENKIKSRHHIIPVSRGGRIVEHNLKVVPIGYHRAYHQLFANLTPKEIRRYMEEVWFNNNPFIPPLVWLQEHKRPQK